jgi:hypothetical protein
VKLASSKTTRASVPASVVVAAGATSKTFTVGTSTTKKNTSIAVSASYAGVTRTATLAITRH